MRVTLEPTSKFVELAVGNERMTVRVWEGVTSNGTPTFAFIARIAPRIREPLPADIVREFVELVEAPATPSDEVENLPHTFLLKHVL